MSKEWFLMMKVEVNVKMKMKETPCNLEYVTVGSELNVTQDSRNPFSCCWKLGTNEDDIY